MATIAFIGLGNMGGPMAANLAAAGHTVRGYDLNPDAVSAVADKGVTAASSIADALDGADVAFTMLPKGDHCKAVYYGPDGVFDNAATTTLLVDSSTIDMQTCGELHTTAQEKGFRFVDAPVSGGISGAQAGTLTFMVGGDEADVEEARTFIEPMSKNIIATGGPTSGEAAKIVNNMMLFISVQACAEGAVLARKLGLDPQTFHDIAAVSSGNSWALQTWYPVPGVVATAAANNGFDATFRADLARKDVGLALAAGEQVGVELPAAALAARGLDQVIADGYADKDCTIVIRNIDPDAPGLPS